MGFYPGDRQTIKSAFAVMPADIVGKPKKVANNTYAWTKVDGSKVFRLHKTDVVELRTDGRVVINSGGWKSATTKERINRYMPSGFYLQTDRGIWYVKHQDKKVVFHDGMILPDALNVSESVAKQAEIEARAIKKRIAKFVKRVDSWDHAYPNSGDCWCCMFETAKIKDGKMNELHDLSHIESHLEEGYLHGTLVYNALLSAGYKDSQMPYVWKIKDIVKRSIRKYLKKRLGLV